MDKDFEETLKRARKNLNDYLKTCSKEEAAKVEDMLNGDPLLEAYLRPEEFVNKQKGIDPGIPNIPNKDWKDLLA